MTLYNSSLIYALLKRRMLGYIVGIAGFAIFGLLQGGFAVAIFLCVNFGFNLVMAVTISICCLAVSALLMNNEWYNNQNFMGKH